jgi:glucose-6-phosphate-specific signal transduction histidine kinase
VALLLGLLGLLTMPAAVEAARRSDRIALLDAAYGVPLCFLLGLSAVVMARRARHNLRWLRLREGGTAVASAAIIVGLVALCLAVTAALSVAFYELVLLYQHSR